LIIIRSIGSLASAVSVATSLFEMKVTNLKPFLNELNMDCLKELLVHSVNGTATKGPTNVKPNGTPVKEQTAETTLQEHPEDAPQSRTSSDIIRGKIQRLGDFIDTDAVGAPLSQDPRLPTDSNGSRPLRHFSSAKLQLNSARTVSNTRTLNFVPVLPRATTSPLNDVHLAAAVLVKEQSLLS